MLVLVSDGDLSLAVGGQVPVSLAVQRCRGPRSAQAPGEASFPAPWKGRAPWCFGEAFGLGDPLWGAAFGPLSGWEGQSAGGGHLWLPKTHVEVLRNALCRDRDTGVTPVGHPIPWQGEIDWEMELGG